MKVDGESTPESTRFLLDTGAILQGLNLPPAACWTTPSVLAEIKPKGATGRRAAQFVAAGLHVQDPSATSRDAVKEAAESAGVLGRLSTTDQEILALSLDVAGLLITDDYTVQDLAKRLGVRWQPATTRGIQEAARWQARCSGCGRFYKDRKAGEECPVCGAEIRLKRPRSSRST